MVQLYHLMEDWSKVMETGATPPVDIFPIFKWLPEHLFGNWISRSRKVGAAMDDLYGRMVARVMQRRLKSGSRSTLLDGVLDMQEKLKLNHNQLNFLCGVLMEGGSDTSSSIILAFVHAMVKYPHVQQEAHAQIDAAIQEERSPLWSDYAQLPYVSQVVKETMRWRPVTPLAFPHAASEGNSHRWGK
jgi:cytochrome P450 family 619